MKVDWELVVQIVAVSVLLLVLLSGCSVMPSMQYCDSVWYSREGSKVHVEMDCLAPMGSAIPGL